MFGAAVRCLAPRGRLVEISATGGRTVEFALADFYHNESRLIGVDSLKYDLVQSAKVLEALRPQFEDGSFRPAPIAATFPLTAAHEAYTLVASGSEGRVVLEPQK